MDKKGIFHVNDRTHQYLSMAQTRRQHQYLGLPGNFKRRLPTTVVFPNLKKGRIDECYLTEEGEVIILEDESKEITDETLKKYNKYEISKAYRNYPRGIYIGVICRKDPKKEFEYYVHGHSHIIKVHYFHFSQEELWEKCENLINKVGQKEELNDEEALDIAFISKFISKEQAPYVVEILAKTFKNAIIPDNTLKVDVGIILAAMISKHTENETKRERLLGEIEMPKFETEIQKIVYNEFGEELDAKDKQIEKQAEEIESQHKEIETKDREIQTKDKEIQTKDKEIEELNKSKDAYKDKLNELKEIKDKNSPKAQKIIQSMLLL
jgi:hypothetical protein